MDSLEYSMLLLLCIMALVKCQVQMSQDGHHHHHPQQQQQEVHANPPTTDLPPHIENRLRDRSHVTDRDHIKEHLDGVAKLPEEMSEDELQFHYFKLHDYDNNNMLDGIELTSAVTHFHKDEEGDHNHDPNNVQSLKDFEIENLVDTILKDEDRNLDGYISYSEFMKSQSGEP